MRYETVIGLEVHAQLATKSKLFCGCATTFGSPPNSQCCPVCLGLPGSLPVMNRRAFELAVKTALALNCKIARRTWSDRKNYYYPDLPKNYQISQNSSLLGTEGCVEIQADGKPKRIRINNVHLEEDAGKLMHGHEHGASYSVVDLNRTGIPLAEIVTEPDMSSAAEAEAYMYALRSILEYTEVSDCKMQEGSLRFEASISLRPEGTERLGSRVEIKNLNSIKAVVRSLQYEIQRQASVLDSGRQVEMETRLWDDDLGRSEKMRSKEEAQDYRYFPEPDLMDLAVDVAWLEAIRSELVELPQARRSRFVDQYQLSDYDASVISADRAVADYFEAVAASGIEAKQAANWVMSGVLRTIKEKRISVSEFPISPRRLADLLKIIRAGAITTTIARGVFERMLEDKREPGEIISTQGLSQISDTSELEAIIDEVFKANPKAVEDYRAGNKNTLNFLKGQVMRQTRGKANPRVIAQLLAQKLS